MTSTIKTFPLSARRQPQRAPGSHSGPTGEVRFPRSGLIALSSAIFLSMSSEFLPSGLQPQMAEEFDRSIAAVGQLITVFAAAVIVTAAPLAVLSRRVDRKALAVIALVGILLANFAVALAPSFEILMAARVAGGIAHGLFWSVAAAYAADLVEPGQLGRATAITAVGGSLSGVLGIPIGNALGQVWGWRAAFVTMAVLGVIVLVVIVVKLPRVPAWRPIVDASGAHSASSASSSSLPAILAICLTILLIVVGQTTLGTYMVAWLVEIARFPAGLVPVHLLATGAAGFVGVWLVGRFSDRFPRWSLYTAATAVVITDILYVLVVGGGVLPVVAIAVVSAIAFSGVPVLLQTRMLRTASRDQRTLAAALQTTAFNVGIGGGAVVGGLVIEEAGLSMLPWVAAGLVAAGTLALVLSDVMRRTRPHASEGS